MVPSNCMTVRLGRTSHFFPTPLGPGADRFLAFLTTPLTSSSEGDAKQKGLISSGTAGMSTLSCRDSWRRESLYVLSKYSSNLSCSTESSPDFGGSSSNLPYLYGSLKKSFDLPFPFIMKGDPQKFWGKYGG